MKTEYVFLLLIVATVLEVSDDAVIRLGIYKHGGYLRLGLFFARAGLCYSATELF